MTLPKKMRNVAIVSFDDSVLSNGLFSESARDNCNLNWRRLKSRFTSMGIELSTYDVFVGKEIDAYIFLGMSKQHLHYYFDKRIVPRKAVLLIREPRIIQQFVWKYLWLIKYLFKKIYTWDYSYLTSQKFDHLSIPSYEDFQYKKERRDQKKLSVLIAGAKKSNEKNELYSYRVKVMRGFHSLEKGCLDLYGFGWENEPGIADIRNDVFKGQAKEKVATIANYKFAFCIENSISDHYLSEKLFDALMAGAIPVYIGDPYVDKKIPLDCFIDMRRFNSFEQLYSFMKTMDDKTYQSYLHSAEKFIASSAFDLYRTDYFVNKIISGILNNNNTTQ